MDRIVMEKPNLKSKERRGVWKVLTDEGQKVMNRACLFSVGTATIAGTVGYYHSGWKVGALHGYSMAFGALPVGMFVYSVLELVQDRRAYLPLNFKDYMMVCGATGVLTSSIISMVATRRVSPSAMVGLRSGLVWAAAGGAYKIVGDELWERSRSHWIKLRVEHSLPEDDGTVTSVIHRLDNKEVAEFYDFTVGTWKKLLTEGKFPEPRYGPLAIKRREDMEKEKSKLQAEKVKIEEEEKAAAKKGWWW